MNPRVLVLAGVLGCLLSASPALGQSVEFGPKVGLTWADVLGDDSGRADARRGFTAGVALVVPVSGTFQVQAEGLYTQKGARFNSRTGRVDLNTAYFEVPVLARLSFPERGSGSVPYLFAGPAFSFEASCEVETFGEASTILTQDCEDSSFAPVVETETVDIGAVMGLGVNVDAGAHSFYLEGRFNAGVRSVDDTGRGLDVRNITLTVLAGFGFGFGG